MGMLPGILPEAGVSSIKQDSTEIRRSFGGENFLHGFKGAQSAPRAVRRVIPPEVTRPKRAR